MFANIDKLQSERQIAKIQNSTLLKIKDFLLHSICHLMHIILETVYISLSGTIANFNFDTSATAVSTSMAHLSSQYYDICIRRARSYCSVCYYPSIFGTTTASSFGIGSSAAATTATAAVGTTVSGVTTISGTVASQVGCNLI